LKLFAYAGSALAAAGILAALFFYFRTAKSPINPHINLIRRVCQQPTPPASQTELGRLLEKVQDDFKDEDARVKKRESFVKALDEVIARTSLARIARCPEEIAMEGYSYKLSFHDPAEGNKNMTVGQNGKEVTLTFNLTKSVQRVLFTYLHEMTHVCQAPRLRTSTSVGEVVRLKMQGEVSAYYNMLLAYRELLPLSPRLCRDEGGRAGPDPLHDFYLEMEKSLEDGSFAQVVVDAYMPTYKKFEAELLDLTSPVHEYYSPELKAKFQMHSLNRRFKELLRELPISLVEP
jgi:hypothetical protein